MHLFTPLEHLLVTSCFVHLSTLNALLRRCMCTYTMCISRERLNNPSAPLLLCRRRVGKRATGRSTSSRMDASGITTLRRRKCSGRCQRSLRSWMPSPPLPPPRTRPAARRRRERRARLTVSIAVVIYCTGHFVVQSSEFLREAALILAPGRSHTQSRRGESERVRGLKHRNSYSTG